MLLPGPEAQQLAVYLGWLMHRTWGGVVAGLLFILPSLFLLVLLSWIYLSFGHVPAVAGVLWTLAALAFFINRLDSKPAFVTSCGFAAGKVSAQHLFFYLDNMKSICVNIADRRAFHKRHPFGLIDHFRVSAQENPPSV